MLFKRRAKARNICLVEAFLRWLLDVYHVSWQNLIFDMLISPSLPFSPSLVPPILSKTKNLP